MKRVLAVMLMALAGFANAAALSTQPSGAAPVLKDSKGLGIWKTVAVDSNGNTIAGGGGGSDTTTAAYVKTLVDAKANTSPSITTTAPYFDNSARMYESGYCTTCTAGAKFTAPTPLNYLFQTAVAVSLTAPANTSGCMVFLTPSASCKTTIINHSSNPAMRYYRSNTPVLPDTNNFYEELPSGATVSLAPPHAYTYLWIWAPGGTTGTALVYHETSNPWNATSYPIY